MWIVVEFVHICSLPFCVFLFLLTTKMDIIATAVIIPTAITPPTVPSIAGNCLASR